MKSQSVSFTLGHVRFSLAIGDANDNGVVDVSLVVRVVGFFELPPVIVDLNSATAQSLIDGFKGIADAVKRKAG